MAFPGRKVALVTGGVGGIGTDPVPRKDGPPS